MKPVVVRNVVIGEGLPKICVPLAGVTKEEILEEAGEIKKISADVAEWRADWYDEVFCAEKVEKVLASLREILGDIPILFTFRTLQEGGERALSAEKYVELNRAVLDLGIADLLDVELSAGERTVEALVAEARRQGVKVVISSHDFEKTPSKEEMVEKLQRMQALGADIPKIAVMPKGKEDVIRLLAATEEMSRKYASGPVVTMSMGGIGAVSRMCGEVFGCALTFGAAKKVSAPGQMGVEDLKTMLELLHKSL